MQVRLSGFGCSSPQECRRTWATNSCVMAYERISALSQKVDFLLGELDDCMKNCFKSGELAEDRRLHSTWSSDAKWNVVWGDCRIDDGCLHSPNFPQDYEAWYSCGIVIEPNWTGFLDVSDFPDELASGLAWYVNIDDSYYMQTGSAIDGLVPKRLHLLGRFSLRKCQLDILPLQRK